MGSFRVILRRVNSLCINYTHKRKRLQRHVTQIDSKYWNKEKERLKHKCPYKKQVEQLINNEIQIIEAARFAAETNGEEPYPQNIRKYIAGEEEHSNTELLWEYYRELFDKNSPASNTRFRYVTSINHLQEFDIDQKGLTKDLLTEYHDYCIKSFSSDNTIEKRVYFLKNFLEWCFNKNYISWYPQYQIKRTTPNPVSLDTKEMDAFIKLELSRDLDECRDIFLFCAATSLAYIDYLRLADNMHWIYEGMIHNPGRQKTGTPQNIPLNDSAQDILDKYPDGLPRRASQVLNRNLKTIGKKAEIKRPVTIKRHRNKKPMYYTYEKWELLSIHKARKTFATLGLQKGIQPFAIKEMGGWKDWKSMKPYIDTVETNYLKEEMKKWNS